MTAQTDFREVGEDFLAHHGIAGMKWGHRNAKADTSTSTTPRTGMSTTKKVAIGVGAVLAVAGIVAIAVVLKKNGVSPVSMIKKTASGARKMSAGGDMAKAMLKQQGHIVVKKAGEKVMDKTTEKLSTKLSDKFDEKVISKAQGSSEMSNFAKTSIGYTQGKD